MADLSTLSDAELMALYKQQQQPVEAQPQDLSKLSDAELMALYNQQKAAPSPYAENPQMLQTPIEFQPRPPEEVRATLGDLPQPELAAELLKIKSPQGGAPTESNVQAMSGTLEKAGSIRDVLHQEVASGGLSPTATLDPQQYPVLAPIWEQYKQEMEPSMAGAAARGAISQMGPTIGGVLGGAAFSPGAIVPGGQLAPIAGAVGGAVAGGMIQQGIESEFRTPQERTAAQAQAAFDEARARGSRAIGEALPMAATLKPALGVIEKALSGDVAAIAQVAIGSALGAGIPAAAGGGWQRSLVGGITGGALQPRQTTGMLMQRPIRAEAKAQQVAGNIVKQYATEAGGLPEALAMRIEGAPSRLTAGGATPFTTEISGNEGLISLGNALANMNAGLRQVRAESRAAISQNIGEALQSRGASFEQTEQFFTQQRDNLLASAQQAAESFIQAGDKEAAKIISDSLAKSQAARTAAEGVVSTAESMLENTQKALEVARAKLSARGGVKNQASVTAKTVLNSERDIEKAAVNKLYDDVRVAGLKSKAENTYKAALEAKGAKGAGLWGDLPDPIQRIITTLKPPKKGATPEVTVQDLMSGIRTLNGKIRASTDPAEQRLLTMVKDGMDADIQALGKVHSDLAVANAAYSSYASRYKDGAAKGVFNKFGGTEDSRTIDAFLNGPVEGVRQLKDALKNKQEGVQSVQDWIVNDLASSVGDSATPAKINAWLSKRNVEGWLKEFPEALPTINAYLSDVSKATEAEGAMTAAVKAAKQRLQGVKVEPTARLEAGVVQAASKRAAAAQVRQAQEVAANSAIARVIGKEPINAITSVMESGNPAKAAKELSNLAATDKTGKATEGLKNAVRQYMDEQRVRFGEVVSTLEDPTATVTMDQLATSYAGLNKMLTAGTQERQVLEQILGKNSRELNMMDMYRGQLETMERFRRAAAGQSVTSLNTALKEEFNNKLQNNLLGFLGKVAYKTLPEKMRHGIAGTTVRALAQVVPDIISGDPSGRARAIMVEAMTDKKLMAQLLRPLDKNNLPEAKAFVKTYLVPQVPNQPQQESK
jgi:hypothetical protein